MELQVFSEIQKDFFELIKKHRNITFVPQGVIAARANADEHGLDFKITEGNPSIILAAERMRQEGNRNLDVRSLEEIGKLAILFHIQLNLFQEAAAEKDKKDNDEIHVKSTTPEEMGVVILRNKINRLLASSAEEAGMQDSRAENYATAIERAAAELTVKLLPDHHPEVEKYSRYMHDSKFMADLARDSVLSGKKVEKDTRSEPSSRVGDILTSYSLTRGMQY